MDPASEMFLRQDRSLSQTKFFARKHDSENE